MSSESPLFLFPYQLTWDTHILSLLPRMESGCNCVQELPPPREVGKQSWLVVPAPWFHSSGSTLEDRGLPANQPGSSRSLNVPLSFSNSKGSGRASLVAQWLRIRLPMQGTRVRALVWEDPTCRGATGPVSHNY